MPSWPSEGKSAVPSPSPERKPSPSPGGKVSQSPGVQFPKFFTGMLSGFWIRSFRFLLDFGFWVLSSRIKKQQQVYYEFNKLEYL